MNLMDSDTPLAAALRETMMHGNAGAVRDATRYAKSLTYPAEFDYVVTHAVNSALDVDEDEQLDVHQVVIALGLAFARGFHIGAEAARIDHQRRTDAFPPDPEDT